MQRPPTEPTESSSQFIYPQRITNQTVFPLIYVNLTIQPRSAGKEWFAVRSLDAAFPTKSLIIKRGRGSVSGCFTKPGLRELAVFSTGGRLFQSICVIVDESPPVRSLSGVLSGGDLLWDSTAVLRLTGDVTIPEGSLLQIEPGVRVELHSQVNIFARGTIYCGGSLESPVTFTAAPREDTGWGGIYHYSTANSYQFAVFTAGGCDETRSFGHSQSQPVLGGEGCQVSLDNVFVIDNPGKAFGFADSRVEIKRSLISRCDTGGEFHISQVTIEDCYFIDMPSGDGIEVDDDNDALYLAGANRNLDTSLIKNTVFITGKDDAVDHNGAIVRITGCLIEDFDNEGVAASNQHWCEVSNTLILDCEQGIEAGYGAPTVIVRHCTLVGNQTGLRLGDWYYHDDLGRIIASDVLSYGNYLHNVWNWDLNLNGPRPGAIVISYSLVNTAEYDTCPGCLTGIPQFNADWTLKPQSPGCGAGSEGGDMGIYSFSE